MGCVFSAVIVLQGAYSIDSCLPSSPHSPLYVLPAQWGVSNGWCTWGALSIVAKGNAHIYLFPPCNVLQNRLCGRGDFEEDRDGDEYKYMLASPALKIAGATAFCKAIEAVQNSKGGFTIKTLPGSFDYEQR